MREPKSKNQEYMVGIDEDLKKFCTCKISDYPPYQVRTFQVLPTDKNGELSFRGSEDNTYIRYPKLIEQVYRAHSQLFLGDEMVVELKGTPKFTGTSKIDEDELIEATNLFDYETLRAWEQNGELRVSFQEKANGKYAIFRLLRLNGELYIFGGSKNRHELHRLTIGEKIDGDGLCIEILNRIIDDLNRVENVEVMIDHTICGEYVDGRHIVWVNEPYMAYFVCQPEWGLPRVKDVLPSQTFLPTLDQLHSIRNMKDIEGVVIVYENTTTGELYRQKHKTIWYTLMRCMREVISKKKKYSISSIALIDKVYDRFSERSRDFLELDGCVLEEYREFAYNFILWMEESPYDYSDAHVFGGLGLAYLLHKFYNRNETPCLPLKTEPKNLEVSDILEEPDYYNAIIEMVERNMKVCVIMSGLPGSGKSTIAHRLATRLNGEVFSADDYFIDENGNYLFDPTKLKDAHATIQELFENSNSHLKIVDNTNTSKWEYMSYQKSASQSGYVCVLLRCKIAPLSVLAERNTHGLSQQNLARMKKRFEKLSPYPMYYGIFFSREDIRAETSTQKTPLHITLEYTGNKKYEKDKQHDIGRIVSVHINRISINPAGKALVVNATFPSPSVPHITLSTNKGYTPKKVGELIDDSNTVPVEGFTLSGVVCGMW